MDRLRIIILTGLSGSGKSTALAALEDAGFFCVDNLPVALLPKFLELQVQTVSEVTRFAFVMDLREKGFLSRFQNVFSELESLGFIPEIIFLEADEDTLIRRYSETRRHHPLSGGGLVESIRKEKESLSALREIAHRVVDTTHLNVHELKSLVVKAAALEPVQKRLQTNVLSFGFKYGIPQDADLVMDVRFLANPYFVPELKNQTGLDAPVRGFVLERPETREFLDKFLSLLDFLMPRYEKEGKAYLTIAVGCTGGRHRSVAVAETIHQHLFRNNANVTLVHRDMDR